MAAKLFGSAIVALMVGASVLAVAQSGTKIQSDSHDQQVCIAGALERAKETANPAEARAAAFAHLATKACSGQSQAQVQVRWGTKREQWIQVQVQVQDDRGQAQGQAGFKVRSKRP